MKQETQQKLYLPSLDGLRFFAFLLVFVSHAPVNQSAVLQYLQSRGWVGVELFFVISSFLFFHLFRREQQKSGSINVPGFYIRRLLRIYPLMFVYPIAMFAIFGSPDGLGLPRIAGILLFSENIISAIKGYDMSVVNVAHLWTLSFEFQIYLVIPLLFSFFAAAGTKKVLWLLGAILVFCTALRIVFFALGTPHPAIWVLPIVRPDSVLIGIALSVIRPTWDWRYSAAGAIVFSALFMLCPAPWESWIGNLFSYPLAALMCGTTVDACLRGRALRIALSVKPLRFLGAISFGLYVYHIVAIHLAIYVMQKSFWPTGDNYFVVAVCTIGISVLMAYLSYRFLEKPFLALKDKFAVVHGRPSELGSIVKERVDLSVGEAHSREA